MQFQSLGNQIIFFFSNGTKITNQSITFFSTGYGAGTCTFTAKEKSVFMIYLVDVIEYEIKCDSLLPFDFWYWKKEVTIQKSTMNSWGIIEF